MANDDNPIKPQIEVQKHLRGMDYPASKDDLVEHARGQGAPEEVLNLLEDLPDQNYTSPTEVTQAVSQ